MAATIEKTAISDIGTMLFKLDNGSSKYKYLFPITAAPATGGAPNQIEVTELDSRYIQNILDREATPAFEFNYNYTAERFAIAKDAFDGVTSNGYLLVFGDGSGFKFTGVGATWTDALSPGNAVVGQVSVAVSYKDFVADVTSVVDKTSIPTGRIFKGEVIA
jgi:hypothetical protein